MSPLVVLLLIIIYPGNIKPHKIIPFLIIKEIPTFEMYVYMHSVSCLISIYVANLGDFIKDQTQRWILGLDNHLLLTIVSVSIVLLQDKHCSDS